MSKPADIEPRWLVSLMSRWAMQTSPGHVSGYASQVAWLSIPCGNSSVRIVQAYARDFTELEAGIDEMKAGHMPELVAMMMHYKPEKVDECVSEGWPWQTTTYYRRLHAGHKKLAERINILRKIKESSTNTLTEQGERLYSAAITVD